MNDIEILIRDPSQDSPAILNGAHFLLVLWKEDAPEDTEMTQEPVRTAEVHMDQPGDLPSVEFVMRTLARVMAKSGHPLYEFLGMVSLKAMDNTVEAVVASKGVTPEKPA